MQRTIVYSILLSLFAIATYSQTLIPGDCLAGQVDTGSHPASAYTPVTYSYAPTTFSGSRTGESMIVMSFNIQSNYDLNCQQVLANQTSFMASIEPDLIGLQETDIDVDIRCDCNIPQAVANALGHTAYFMQMFPWRTGKYGDTTAVGYEVADLTYVYYNVSNPYFEQRGALAHLISPPQLNGQKMWYINTHLEETSLDIRVIQVTQLINWVENTLFVQEPLAVVVITGDFYTVPGDSSYATMASYFTNAWATFNGSPDGGYTHPSDAPSERFDHIWWKEPAAGNIKVNLNDFVIVDTLLSDHRPIYANMSFTTTSGSASTPTPSPATPAPTSASTGTDGSSTPAPTSASGTTGTDGSSTPAPTSASGSTGTDGSSTPAPTSASGSTGTDGSSTPAPTSASGSGSSTPAPTSASGSTGTDGSSTPAPTSASGSGSSTPAPTSGSGGSGSSGSTEPPTSAPSNPTDAPTSAPSGSGEPVTPAPTSEPGGAPPTATSSAGFLSASLLLIASAFALSC